MTLRQRFIDGFTMFVVSGLSLLLLLYVAFGEGRRGYEQIHIEKITAQGRLIQALIEKYLREDLPLKQYAGFTALAGPIVESEDFDAIGVYDHLGHQLFFVLDKTNPQLPEPSGWITRVNRDIQVERGETHYQIILPLRTRFETVGSVVVTSPTHVVSKRVYSAFGPLPIVGAALSLVFALSIALASPLIERSKVPWLQIGYASTFLIMSGFVIFTLVTMYFDAVQGKTKASAFALSQRLNDVVEFNLNVRDFVGIDKGFKEFRRVNSEISEAALLLDGRVEITTDDKEVGKEWHANPQNFEYMVDLSRTGAAHRTSLAVTVPRSVVYERVGRSVKNFAALFIASAFLSGLFLQVAGSLRRQRSSNSGSDQGEKPAFDGEAALVIVKPIFFLAVFLDSLTYSFLPKFMQEAATSSGVSVGLASLPFTMYYLFFALSLIPAGTIADRRGPRPLIVVGLILAGASVLGLTLSHNIWMLTAFRSVAGIGQGLLFIGVQTFILAVTPPEKKTRGAAIIVFGFQAGMISGMALGSLLVNFLHSSGVFIIAGVVGFASAIYTVSLLPTLPQKQSDKGGLSSAVSRLLGDLKKVITSGEFLKTILCIGIPAKAILTGTITFALPLILGQLGYLQEDIGQIIMLYGLGVVAASGQVSRLVDRTRNTQSILFSGALLSGAGLAAIGFIGYLNAPLAGTAAVVLAVTVVGIAHGFINAPVVTHVGQSNLAGRIGANPVTTTYRFLERIGHVAGPFIVSQLFLLWGQGPHVVAAIGVATVLLGLLFVAGDLFARRRAISSEPAE